MSLFEKPRKLEGTAPESVPLPARCGCKECTEAVSVLLVSVRNAHGKEKIGAPSQFGRGTSQGWVPAPGFTFVGWIARCAAHYRDDLYRVGKGHLSEFAEVRQQVLDTSPRSSSEEAPW